MLNEWNYKIENWELRVERRHYSQSTPSWALRKWKIFFGKRASMCNGDNDGDEDSNGLGHGHHQMKYIICLKWT